MKEFGKQLIRVNIQMLLLIRAFKSHNLIEYGNKLNKMTIAIDDLRMMGCPSRYGF